MVVDGQVVEPGGAGLPLGQCQGFGGLALGTVLRGADADELRGLDDR